MKNNYPISPNWFLVGILLLVITGVFFTSRHAEVPPAGNTVSLPDGAVVRNVEAIGPQGDALVARVDGAYQIDYANAYDAFTISVFGKDFERSRHEAEQKFLSIVSNGSVADACRRTVRIIAFPIEDPVALKELHLSFCSS